MRKALLVVAALAVLTGCSSLSDWRFLPQKQGPAFASIAGAVTAEAAPVTVARESGHKKVGVVLGVTVPGQPQTEVFCPPELIVQCEDYKTGHSVIVHGTTALEFVIAKEIKNQ